MWSIWDPPRAGDEAEIENEFSVLKVPAFFSALKRIGRLGFVGPQQ